MFHINMKRFKGKVYIYHFLSALLFYGKQLLWLPVCLAVQKALWEGNLIYSNPMTADPIILNLYFYCFKNWSHIFT